MALNVRPVKLRESFYLLIPVDVARLVGVAASSRFQLNLTEDKNSVQLVYELKKERDLDDKQVVEKSRAVGCDCPVYHDEPELPLRRAVHVADDTEFRA